MGFASSVVSWGGSYGRAVDEGAIIPFTEATGIPVNVEDYNGGLAEIRAQVEIGNIHWDVVSLGRCIRSVSVCVPIPETPPRLPAQRLRSAMGWRHRDRARPRLTG